MENEVNVQDLVSLSYEQKPIDFEQAFNSLVTDRIASAIETRKTEIAQSMLGGSAPEEYEDDQEIEEPEDLDTTDFENTSEEPEDGETA